MKKKWILWVIVAAVAIFVVAGIVIPYASSNKFQKENQIERLIKDIFEYPDLDDASVARIQGNWEDVMGNAKQKARFEEQALDAIGNMELSATNANFMFYKVTQQQLLLEMLGCENAQFREAYTAKLQQSFELYESLLRLDGLAEATLQEPLTYDKIYADQPAFYISPGELFLEDYLPGYVQEAQKDNTTGALLRLCHDLAAVKEYGNVDVTKLLSVEDVLQQLKTGAEQIIVKENAGGYYDGKSNDSSSDFDKQDFGPGEYTDSSVSTIRYYGDLACYSFVKTGNYSWDDENGEHQSISSTEYSRSTLYLRGEKIADTAVVEKYIKYAREDGMVNYHKDGCCFAVGDTALVGYTGNSAFLFQF